MGRTIDAMKFANALLAVIATVVLIALMRPTPVRYITGPAIQPIQVVDVVDGGPLPFTVDSIGTYVSGDGNSR